RRPPALTCDTHGRAWSPRGSPWLLPSRWGRTTRLHDPGRPRPVAALHSRGGFRPARSRQRQRLGTAPRPQPWLAGDGAGTPRTNLPHRSAPETAAGRGPNLADGIHGLRLRPRSLSGLLPAPVAALEPRRPRARRGVHGPGPAAPPI